MAPYDIVQNFIAIVQTVAELWRCLLWRPSTIFDFKKVKFSTFGRVRTGAMYHCAKVHSDSLNGCGDTAIGQLLKIDQRNYSATNEKPCIKYPKC